MTLVQPQHFHRLALAVNNVHVAANWFTELLGAFPVGRPVRPRENDAEREQGNLAGTDQKLLWIGGYPMILLTGGAVANFLARYGPGVQSFAWEVEDNWEVEHIVRDRGIRVISVNIGGRFFFMHPKDTHGLLLEWCDGKISRDPRAAEPSGGVVATTGVAWASAVVADADESAAWMSGLMETNVVDGNPKGPESVERTIDLAVGDISIRLITPLSGESRYAPVLEGGARVHSFALRVPDLDEALATLAARGITTQYRSGSLAATDPATTLGLQLEWTE